MNQNKIIAKFNIIALMNKIADIIAIKTIAVININSLSKKFLDQLISNGNLNMKMRVLLKLDIYFSCF